MGKHTVTFSSAAKPDAHLIGLMMGLVPPTPYKASLGSMEKGLVLG